MNAAPFFDYNLTQTWARRATTSTARTIMNTQTWTYLDDRGGRHEVNLYHSPRGGKLLVQVDKQTVIATVHAKKDGRWTFLIEDELCDIVLSRRGLEWFYGFEINHHANTPRNRAYRRQNRRGFWLPMGIFLVALAICSALIFGKDYFFKKREKPVGESLAVGSAKQISQLNAFGKTTVATLTNGSRSRYSFKIDSAKTYGGSFILTKNAAGQPVLPNGFPLENGDEFTVVFLPENPNIHRLELMQPVENQLIKYENRAADVHQILHPNEAKTRARCLAKLARKATGLRGLNDIFYQNLSREQNAEHNRETFGRLVRDETFKKMLVDNCLE